MYSGPIGNPQYKELSGLRQLEVLSQGQIGVKTVHILAVLQKYWNLTFRVRLHIRLVILVIQTSRFSQEQTIEISLTLAAGWTEIRELTESYLEMTIWSFSGHQRWILWSKISKFWIKFRNNHKNLSNRQEVGRLRLQ